MTVKLKEKIGTFDPPLHQKKFYEDEYAVVSFLESVPCIKIKISGVPHSSEHYQLVQSSVLETIQQEKDYYCRLHLLTDNSKAGMVLDEDLAFYKNEIIDRLYPILKRRKIPVVSGPETLVVAGNRSVSFLDPDGNRVEIACNANKFKFDNRKKR